MNYTMTPDTPETKPPEPYRSVRYYNREDHARGVFFFESSGGAFYGAAYHGKSSKPEWNYRLRSEDQLKQLIEATKKKWEARAEARSERRRTRAEVDAGQLFKVGEIIVNSWGYDQTNIDFYKVTKVMKRFVEVVRINGCGHDTGFMSGDTVPGDTVKDGAVPERHGVYVYNGQGQVNFEFGCGSKWDGKPEHYSYYA